MTGPCHAPQLTAMVLRPRPLPGSLSNLPFPRTLRRSVSTLSNPIAVPDGNIRPPALVRRADSFSVPAPTTLKRAPSFGSVTSRSNNRLNSPDDVVHTITAPVTEKQPQDPETDEEEKARQKKVKRPRTKSNGSSRSGTPEKRKKAEGSPQPVQTSSPTTKALRSRTIKPASPALEKKLRKSSAEPSSSPTAVSNATKPTVSSAAKQKVKVKAATTPSRSITRSSHPRVDTIFGPELPAQTGTQTSPVADIDVSTLDPSQRGVLPPAPSPTRTLRRVKTTVFNNGIGRRISFGSLPVPSGNPDASSNQDTGEGKGLGSAFELSCL